MQQITSKTSDPALKLFARTALPSHTTPASPSRLLILVRTLRIGLHSPSQRSCNPLWRPLTLRQREMARELVVSKLPCLSTAKVFLWRRTRRLPRATPSHTRHQQRTLLRHLPGHLPRRPPRLLLRLPPSITNNHKCPGLGQWLGAIAGKK